MWIVSDDEANTAVWVAILVVVIVLMCILDWFFRWTGRCWTIVVFPFRCCFPERCG